jgi:hypothetical protein
LIQSNFLYIHIYTTYYYLTITGKSVTEVTVAVLAAVSGALALVALEDTAVLVSAVVSAEATAVLAVVSAEAMEALVVLAVAPAAVMAEASAGRSVMITVPKILSSRKVFLFIFSL